MGTLLFRGILLLLLLPAPVFPAWAQDSKGVGVVTALTGRADLRRPQAPQGQALKLRDSLYVRDVVDTQKESLARILLLGKSTVTVRELSRFEVREETLPDGAQRAVINLAAGKIRVIVARRLMKPGDEVHVRTPNAVASVRGTEGIFEVTTLPDGRPQTEVFGISGEFEVTVPPTPPITAMADVVSDAPSGIRLAQASASYVVGGVGIPNNVLRLVGFPPVVTSRTGTLLEALQELRGFRGASVGSLTGTGTAHTSDRAAAAADRIAASVTTRTGETVMSGNVAQIARNPFPGPITPAPILPTTSRTPVTAVLSLNEIVTTPFHIQVTWGTGARDLDLHLTGPQGESRFHVYYASQGSLTSQPFATLNRDCRCTGGSEVITVQQVNQGGVYRASVFNFGDARTTSTNVSTAAEAELRVIRGGTVVDRPATGGGTGSIVTGGTTVTSVAPTPGLAGNTWRAVEINPATGQVTRVNQILNSSSSSGVQ